MNTNDICGSCHIFDVYKRGVVHKKTRSTDSVSNTGVFQFLNLLSICIFGYVYLSFMI